jgi:hypothetical protein
MIKQLEKAISKLSELSEIEQEKIAQMIMITIENKTKLVNFRDTLEEISETALLSESSLAKDWLKPEEDEAWKNL